MGSVTDSRLMRAAAALLSSVRSATIRHRAATLDVPSDSIAELGAALHAEEARKIAGFLVCMKDSKKILRELSETGPPPDTIEVVPLYRRDEEAP